MSAQAPRGARGPRSLGCGCSAPVPTLSLQIATGDEDRGHTRWNLSVCRDGAAILPRFREGLAWWLPEPPPTPRSSEFAWRPRTLSAWIRLTICWLSRRRRC